MIVPEGMRAEMKEKLHHKHCGIQATLRRARDVFYWPGMNNRTRTLRMSYQGAVSAHSIRQQTRKNLLRAIQSQHGHGNPSQQIYFSFEAKIISLQWITTLTLLKWTDYTPRRAVR